MHASIVQDIRGDHDIPLKSDQITKTTTSFAIAKPYKIQFISFNCPLRLNIWNVKMFAMIQLPPAL